MFKKLVLMSQHYGPMNTGLVTQDQEEEHFRMGREMD